VLSRRWDNALKEGGEPSPVGFFKIEQYVSSIVSGSNENPVESETAETAIGVFEDTADGIVLLSSMSIAAAKERELSFKLSAAAGRHSHSSAPMQTCGW
jgi:hypothetical protein